MLLPEKFQKRMQAMLEPSQANDLFTTITTTAPVTAIRLNPAKANPLDFDFADIKQKPVPWNSLGYYLEPRPIFATDPSFHGGGYYVQDAAAMLLEKFLDELPTRPLKVLDACAAPGGKSTLLASLLSPGSLLVCNDVDIKRAAVLRQNMHRWGFPEVIVTQRAPVEFAKLEHFFDLIIMDVPCSGEGMFRKSPASLAQWSPELIESCAIRQKQLLADIVPALATGGTLIYATCSYAAEENEHVVADCLAKYPNTLQLFPKMDLADFGALPVTIAGVQEAGYRCLPHRMAGEGMFFCRLRKKDSGEILGNITEVADSVATLPKEAQDFLHEYVNTDLLLGEVRLEPPHLTYYPKGFDALAAHNLATIKSALPLATYITKKTKHKPHKKQRKSKEKSSNTSRFLPTTELALSQLCKSDLPKILLDKDAALRYLCKQDITLPAPSELAAASWVLAAYLPRGENEKENTAIPLGWYKVVRNGEYLNNALEKAWTVS